MIDNIEKIKKGTKVEYSLYTNITFEGIEGNCVVLKDKNGNIKKVFTSLFKRYGKI